MLAQQIGIVSNQGQWERDKDQLYRQASNQLNNQTKPNYKPPNPQRPP